MGYMLNQVIIKAYWLLVLLNHLQSDVWSNIKSNGKNYRLFSLIVTAVTVIQQGDDPKKAQISQDDTCLGKNF